MDLDDSFTIAKNRRPDDAKNRNRHASAEDCLANLNDRYGIVKTYHVWAGEQCWTKRYHEKMDRTAMRRDLRPFVVYSMNKRRNWEIDELIGVQLIEEIQNMHKGQDVFVMERVALEAYKWPNLFRYDYQWNNFRILTVHELNTYVSGRPSYEETRVNSIYGQYFPHFLKHNRCDNKEDSELTKKKYWRDREEEKRTAVVYHLIKPPENYLTVFQKQFEKNCHGRWNNTFMERIRRRKMCQLDVRYDDHSDIAEDWEDSEEDVLESMPRSACYNLEDHLVEHFVRVKGPRKKR